MTFSGGSLEAAGYNKLHKIYTLYNIMLLDNIKTTY